MDGMRLDGRVAVVTGGAGAIGAAIGADVAGLVADLCTDAPRTSPGRSCR
jgi:2-hydroxycyclohexanecarboxyl-CoA dehydrogenase